MCFILLLFLVISPRTSFAQAFLQTPIAGEHLKDFIIVNYVDWGLDEDLLDHQCGSKTYKGHQGTDFVIQNFQIMDSGIAVLAAASGRVIFVEDQLFDREKRSVILKGLGNYIAISHPNGYQTYYAHNKKGSARVKPGDIVNIGDTIAFVGSSGNSTDPHLHFEIWFDSSFVVDPFAGTCGNENSLWLDPIDYDTSFGIWTADLTNFIPDLDTLRERPLTQNVFNSRDEAVTYWNISYGVKKDDIFTIKWYQPNGEEWFSNDYTTNQDYWYFYYWNYIDVPTPQDQELWNVKLFRNNIMIDERAFLVNDALSVSSVNNNNEINIYPNPTRNKFTIQFNGQNLSPQNNLEYQIFNSFGQNLITGKLDKYDSNCEIDISNLPIGLYFLEIYDQNQFIKNIKIIRE
jgi:hypothetical protein